MKTHSGILAGKLHGQRSLVGSSPWGRKEHDAAERQHVEAGGGQPSPRREAGGRAFSEAEAPPNGLPGPVRASSEQGCCGAF